MFLDHGHFANSLLLLVCVKQLLVYVAAVYQELMHKKHQIQRCGHCISLALLKRPENTNGMCKLEIPNAHQ